MTHDPIEAAPHPSALEPEHAAAQLADACSRVAPPLDLVSTCGAVIAPLAAAARANRGSILILNPLSGRLLIAAGLGLPPGLIGEDLRPKSRSIAEWVFRNQRPLILNGEIRDQRFEGSDKTLDSALCMPLEGFDGPLGVINLSRQSPAPAFAESEILDLAGLVRPVTAAVERLQRSRRAERSLWQLDPANPVVSTLSPAGGVEVRHYEMGFASVPGMLQGFDLCDRVPHPNGGQSLLIADLAGNGGAAACAAAFLQGVFVANASPERSAAGMVARLNAEANARLDPRAHAAVWLGQLAKNGELAYCNAGYPPPLWVPSDDSSITVLDRGGPVLGPFPDARYEEERVRLLPGDMVVAVSDALLDARDATDQRFGVERVSELIQELRRQPLERLTRALCEAASSHSGRSVPPDDFSVLALRYRPGH